MDSTNDMYPWQASLYFRAKHRNTPSTLLVQHRSSTPTQYLFSEPRTTRSGIPIQLAHPYHPYISHTPEPQARAPQSPSLAIARVPTRVHVAARRRGDQSPQELALRRLRNMQAAIIRQLTPIHMVLIVLLAVPHQVLVLPRVVGADVVLAGLDADAWPKTLFVVFGTDVGEVDAGGEVGVGGEVEGDEGGGEVGGHCGHGVGEEEEGKSGEAGQGNDLHFGGGVVGSWFLR